jgi:hypothetical protein
VKSNRELNGPTLCDARLHRRGIARTHRESVHGRHVLGAFSRNRHPSHHTRGGVRSFDRRGHPCVLGSQKPKTHVAQRPQGSPR